ncbi:MAG: cytochrome P450 [Hyphomicrobiales bacterium]|nr:MAG: cytochrome P450 [Hyphomicrobiales bacterium]
MNEFVPPYPPRAEKWVPLRRLIKVARKNFLAVFPRTAYDKDFLSGQVLRRPMVLVNSPALIKEAFGQKHSVYQRKSPQMRHALHPLLGDGLFISDGDVWSQRRKIVAPIIHTNRLSEFAPTMIEAAMERREAWLAAGDGTEIDVMSEMAKLTAEIICRSVFGKQLDAEHGDEIVDGFFHYQKHVDQTDIMSLLKIPDWLPRPRGLRVRRAKNRVLAVLEDVISRTKEHEAGNENSVVSTLIAARDEDGKPLSRAAIRNEAAVIFMAGYETTANTLSWAWYILSQADWARERLHAELDEVLAGRVPTLEDVKNLPYTRAIIEEVLRLYPPVPMLAREASSDETIGSHKVEKGTIVLVCPWLLQRNPKLWKKPDNFVPERFLPDSGPAPSKYAYVPFSTGPRVCAGLTFGLTEAIICLAVLAQKVDLKLSPSAEVEAVCRLTLRPGESLPMTVHRRAEPAAAPTPS